MNTTEFCQGTPAYVLVDGPFSGGVNDSGEQAEWYVGLYDDEDCPLYETAYSSLNGAKEKGRELAEQYNCEYVLEATPA